jgi:hypothetical protein
MQCMRPVSRCYLCANTSSDSKLPRGSDAIMSKYIYILRLLMGSQHFDQTFIWLCKRQCGHVCMRALCLGCSLQDRHETRCLDAFISRSYIWKIHPRSVSLSSRKQEFSRDDHSAQSPVFLLTDATMQYKYGGSLRGFSTRANIVCTARNSLITTARTTNLMACTARSNYQRYHTN